MTVLRKFFALFALAAGTAAGLPAFPGAQGWGSETPGGRGGKVYVVTTTASSGPGSFSQALMATGPRIIVFRVSGVIRANGPVYGSYELRAPQNTFTIAGQTSPGGITLQATGYEGFWFNYNNPMKDVVVRFVRFRSGNAANQAFQMAGVSNLILDHCSFSGGTDEDLDISGSHDFTVQWCTVTNSSKNGQNYGIIFSYPPTNNISFHHNFSAHHVWRCAPHMHWKDTAPPNRGSIDHTNNVFYNFVYQAIWDEGASGPVDFNLIGNVFKAGPNTTATQGTSFSGPMNVYSPDNQWVSRSGQWSSDPVTQSGGSRYPTPAVTTHTARQAFDTVLAKAGALPQDAMDIRTADEARNGTGTLGKQDDPLTTSGPSAPFDADLDGMPDCWELANGLNPGNAADATQDKFGRGYNSIEEYFNDLASILQGELPRNPTCQTVVETYSKSASVSWLSVSPNPCPVRGRVTFGLPFRDLHGGGFLQIVDDRGRRVAELPASRISRWSPGRVAPGVYFVRWMQGGVIRGLRKLILL